MPSNKVLEERLDELAARVPRLRQMSAGGGAVDTEVVIPAEAMNLTLGAAALADFGDAVVYWALDAAASEAVAGAAQVPAGWATFNVVARMLNVAATAGNLRLRVDTAITPTGALPTVTTGTATTVAASATANLIFEATLATGVVRPANGTARVSFTRLGADVADTLANDVGLVELRLVKTA